MKKFKLLFIKLLSPPLWQILLLTALSAAGLVLVFAKGWDSHPIAYGIYVFSFYTLTVLCIFCVRVLPGTWREYKAKIYASKLFGRYLTDPVYKARVSLHRSLAINLLYAAVNLISGLVYKSAWFHILAGYYLILSVMRFLLLRFVRKTGIGKNRLLEWRRSRLCAWILLLVNVALSGAVLMMMYQGRGYDYGPILIYAMALYTFYITISATLDLFKYRRSESPVLSTARVIKLTSALVSMLNLETSMFAAFGADGMGEKGQRIMIAATGAGVSAVVIVLALVLIAGAARALRQSPCETDISSHK